MTAVPPVLAAIRVRRPADVAFRTVTERIGEWRPLTTHGVYGGRAAGLAIVDGQLVERSWTARPSCGGRVVRWEPPLRFGQAATEVGVYIVDGTDVAVDQPMPIGRVLAVQASFHLPAHTDQLRALRPT